MKRNLLRLGLSLIALFVMVVANAQTYQNEEASVSWPFNDANYATQYTKSPEKGFSLVSVNTGDLKYVAKTSTKTLDKNGSPMVMAGFSPVGSTKAVEWTVKPSKGLTFTPTSISTYVNRFGTDAENGVTVTAKLSDGTSVDLGNFTALRENKTTETDKFSKNENLTNHIVIQLTADQQAKLTSAEGFTLSCTVGVGSTKQQGFADVHINGLLNGTIEKVAQYTLSAVVSNAGAGTIKVSPSGTVFDAETQITVTATKNFGYKFVNWTDANNKVVSTDEEYTFSISANTALKANFEKINTYALDYKVEGGAKGYMVSATPAPTIVNGKNMYEEGTEVTLTASSNDILTFTNWNDGETGAERKIKMNVDQSYTAAYSAKDFIAGWDFYKSAREGRTADFAAADNDVDQLILRDADGNTYAWLDKSNSAGGYEGKNAAVNWTSKKTKALGETYWQTKVNATAFTDIKVKSSMLYNYNAYETYNVEYSLNGTDWTKVGTIKMPGTKAWTDGEFTLPADANNKAEVYIRWIADKTSSIKGATGDNDGIAITNIYITGTAQLVNDGKAHDPVLVTRILDREGNEIYVAPSEQRQAIPYKSAFLMQQLLLGGLREPGGTSMSLWRYVRAYNDTEFGGKTGTSNNHSDAWFVGVSPKIVVGAWVGGEYRSIHFRTGALGQGSRTALPICGNFLESLLGDPAFKRYHGKFAKPTDEIEYEMYNCSSYYRKKENPDSSLIDSIGAAISGVSISLDPEINSVSRDTSRNHGGTHPTAPHNDKQRNKTGHNNEAGKRKPSYEDVYF